MLLNLDLAYDNSRITVVIREFNIRTKLYRVDIEMMGDNKPSHPEVHHNNQQKNDHLTIKWMTNTISELKNELSEIQIALNTSVILQNKEQTVSEISLLRSDVENLNKELDKEKNRKAHHEAVINELRDEVLSLRNSVQSSFVINGKLKNQV